ncbi:MAG: ECF transporter S component [Candidatus Bathyarchaeia archaeon]|jgi:riboflavin transporter FmnP
MNAKSVALCSMFVALAVLLARITIPVGPISLYFWEIPIVIALLLFGNRFGFTVAVISVFTQALVFPRSMGLLFPVWNLIAMSTTLAAIALIRWFFCHKISETKYKAKSEKRMLIGFVAAALLLRVGIMPFVDYFMYKFMLPIFIGQAYTDTYIMGLMSFILVYNTVLTLYTVPTSYTIARKLNQSLKISTTFV